MLNKIWAKVDKMPKKGVGFIEWAFFAVIAVISYIFFCHQDILVTAGHAVEYLNGHITDFYSGCKATDGTYGANYLPTTFIIFAIWNIPMKLLSMTPDYVGDWSTGFIMWNKLLPTIAFMVSGFVMYRLVTEKLGFEKPKAMTTVFLFFTTPMAFFSQFFFCQYDIFTVLFMLCGMYYIFKEKPSKKDYFLFALFFGIATTFKYFALLIFIILVLLRIKNVWKVFVCTIPAVAPVAIEVLFYGIFDRKAFLKSVFGFDALDNAGGFLIDIGGVSINILYVVLIGIIAFSYFTKTKDFQEYIGYGMFYSCGICFALFAMMKWYPQWLLFMAPFWVISTVINKRYEIFFWIDTLLGLVLDVYIVNAFADAVDQTLFRFGIFHDALEYSMNASQRMKYIFVFQDKNILFTLIAAIFLIGFIFKHPKNNFKSLKENLNNGRFIINVRFLAFTLAFIIGAFACLPNFLNRPQIVWERFGGLKQEIVAITDKKVAEEYTTIDAKMVQNVYIVCDEMNATGKKARIICDVIDTKTNKKVATGSAKEKDIVDGSHTFTTIKLDEKFYPDKDTTYCFRFYTDSPRKVAIYFEKNKKEVASYYKTYQKDYTGSYSTYKGKVVKNKELVMRLVGEAE